MQHNHVVLAKVAHFFNMDNFLLLFFYAMFSPCNKIT